MISDLKIPLNDKKNIQSRLPTPNPKLQNEINNLEKNISKRQSNLKTIELKIQLAKNMLGEARNVEFIKKENITKNGIIQTDTQSVNHDYNRKISPENVLVKIRSAQKESEGNKVVLSNENSNENHFQSAIDIQKSTKAKLSKKVNDKEQGQFDNSVNSFNVTILEYLLESFTKKNGSTIKSLSDEAHKIELKIKNYESEKTESEQNINSKINELDNTTCKLPQK